MGKIKTRKFHQKWSEYFEKKIRKEYDKYFELAHNENAAYENLQVSAKAAFRGKYVALTAYIRKEERMKVNNLSLCLRMLST